MAKEEVPEPPPDLLHLWLVFVRLHSRRSDQPIPLTEFEAYSRLYQYEFRIWEIDVLSDLDDAVLEMRTKKGRGKWFGKREPASRTIFNQPDTEGMKGFLRGFKPRKNRLGAKPNG